MGYAVFILSRLPNKKHSSSNCMSYVEHKCSHPLIQLELSVFLYVKLRKINTVEPCVMDLENIKQLIGNCCCR